MMKLPFPKKCDQKWLEMKENEQGRLCSKCENTIIDFRNKTWNEIRQTQFDSNYTTCGLYSKKQLKNWDPNKEYKSGIHAAAATVLLSLSQLVSNPSYAQNNNPEVPIHTVEDSTKFESSEATQFYKIRGQIIDAETGEPMPFVKIIVNQNFGAMSDFDGNYQISIPVYALTNNIISITCQTIGYESITLEDIILHESKLTQLDFKLKYEAQLTYFVIEAPTKRDVRREKKAKKKEERKLSKNN